MWRLIIYSNERGVLRITSKDSIAEQTSYILDAEENCIPKNLEKKKSDAENSWLLL